MKKSSKLSDHRVLGILDIFDNHGGKLRFSLAKVLDGSGVHFVPLREFLGSKEPTLAIVGELEKTIQELLDEADSLNSLLSQKDESGAMKVEGRCSTALLRIVLLHAQGDIGRQATEAKNAHAAMLAAKKLKESLLQNLFLKLERGRPPGSKRNADILEFGELHPGMGRKDLACEIEKNNRFRRYWKVTKPEDRFTQILNCVTRVFPNRSL